MKNQRVSTLRVVFFLCDRMLATSVTLPMEQLHAAVTLARTHSGKHANEQTRLEITLVSQDGQAVNSHTGFPIHANASCAEIVEADIVYLPALWRNPIPVIKNNQDVPGWIKKLYEKGSLIAGVGTGCYFMAEAGLLEKKPATTHWHYFDKFQERYPNVQLKRQYFITQSSNIYCTGSVNSLADLTIHFIQRFFSASIAQEVERHFFHEIRRAYDSAAVFNEKDQVHPDEDIIQTQIWIKDNFEKAVTINELAKTFGMSTRNFSRRFKNATGSSPLHYLQKVRLDAAKDLLKTSNLSIAETMLNVGYQDSTHFASLFKKQHGTTPRQYRSTVRAKMFKLNQE